MASDWECSPRCHAVTKNYFQSYQTIEHPLILCTVTVVDSKGTRGNPCGSIATSSNTSSRASSNISLLAELDGTDPLTQLLRQDLTDPLSVMATEYKKSKKHERYAPNCGDTLNWNSKRLGILNRFTTTEKLSISTSFLSTGVGTAGMDTIKAQTIVADKVKYRLEQLDDFEDGSLQHMMDLTQQEYIQRIQQLNQELVQSWDSDQRVKALKIAIQCSKMLADVSVLQFYPSRFVLITDILDIFGKLVYQRLNGKVQANAESAKKIATKILRESARETCLNWFYKIASIRELLPRLYVEMSIIKCYEFLSQCEFDTALLRLTKIIRGIADPLVAIYARCYLVRVGLSVTSNTEYIFDNFNDFLQLYPMVFIAATRSEVYRQHIELSTYLTLYGPALDFLLQALDVKNTYKEQIMLKSKGVKNNGPLLIAMLNSFKSEYIAANALEFVNLISNCNAEHITSKSQLFRALGNSVTSCAPLQAAQCFNAAFQTINTFTDSGDYINCVETWAQFVAENFTVNEINIFMGDINAQMCQDKSYEKHYQQLQSILHTIMQSYKNIELLFIQENFLPFLDLFHKESVKVEVCRNILTIFKLHSQEDTSDPIVTHALMHIGKILNDSVTSMTMEDERRQSSHLISSFIRKVNFGNDFEQQLSFYVEARSIFTNLDIVNLTLVHAVLKLSMDERRLVKCNRKTAAFMKACAAFCFITVPSISSVQVQMDLYLLSGQVALFNFCLGQADACFEAALHLVPELPRSVEIEGKLKSLETFLVSYLCNLLATLIVVPDSPERGVLYLLRLLLDVLNKFPFELHSPGPTIVYLHALDMLYVQSLEEFPYHIPDVVSNDELYGRDPKFLVEVNNICVQVVDQILNQLKAMAAAQQYHMQATLALELLLRIVRYADLSKEKTFQLALNLWMLAAKFESHVDVSRTLRTIEDIYKIIEDSNSQRARCLAQLIMRMYNR